MTTATATSTLTTDTFLDPEEVKGLTEKSRRPSQVKVLNSMGIEHRVRHGAGGTSCDLQLPFLQP